MKKLRTGRSFLPENLRTLFFRVTRLVLFFIFLLSWNVFAFSDLQQKDGREILGAKEMVSSEEINQQQTKAVTGKVVDDFGKPLPGVSVILEGTMQGAVTDITGIYSIENVPDNAVLIFSFIGMKQMRVELSGQTRVDMVMEE